MSYNETIESKGDVNMKTMEIKTGHTYEVAHLKL